MLKIPDFLRLNPQKPDIKIGHIETLTGRDLARFLSEFPPEELRQVRELWRKYAARKELIDFGANDAKPRIRL